MYLSRNWLNDFVDIKDIDPHELAERITLASAEVEGVTSTGHDIEGIVVGRVVACSPHPTSKKLTLAKVDIGGETLDSVCGAPNCREGLLTPFCPVGGKVRGVGLVQARDVAGQPSRGVCCSPMECGLGESHERLVELPEDCRPGQDWKELAGIDDVVLEIDNKSLTHRPDLWGHYGFAREIAALLGRPLRPLPHLPAEQLTSGDGACVDVRVEDTQGCPRYACLKLDNLRHAASPLWMQARLAHVGLRAINLAVDLTNYVLLELGQPMHAFDAAKVRAIRVASTSEPITFTTLDEVERRIPAGVVMIHDGDTPIALAGIMGGMNSEVSAQTTSLLLESANFDAYRIRRATIEIGHRTDSSARFEKSLDPELAITGIGRFVHLLQQAQPQARIASELADVCHAQPNTPTISVTQQLIDRAIGEHVPPERVEAILNSLSLHTTRDGETYTVRVPGFRATRDIAIPMDVVEEVARIHGYQTVAPQTPLVRLERYPANEHRKMERKAKQALAARFGFSEVQTYPWFDDNWLARVGDDTNTPVIRVTNPQSPEAARLRTSIVPNLLAVVERNRVWQDQVRVFELGSIFAREGEQGAKEGKWLTLAVARRDDGAQADGLFRELRGVVDWLCQSLRGAPPDLTPCDGKAPSPWAHPSKSAGLSRDGVALGYLGLARPDLVNLYPRGTRLAMAELDFDALVALPAVEPDIRPVPRFPQVDLDFSLLADEGARHATLLAEIKALGHTLQRSSRLVDIYTGSNLPQGKKSMTYRVVIGSDERTLTGAEIDGFTKTMIEHLEQRGYQVRAA